jgi:exodeoxyribonuclease VII large subunit
MKNYSLSELAALVQGALETFAQETFWVRAEIASLTVRNGHAYLELVEKAPSGLQAARMRATCWSSLYPMLDAFFREETGRALQTGMQVLIEVEIDFHAVYGFSLNIRNIDPRFTLGDMARQRQLTILRLQQEGVFGMQHELVLPTVVNRLAVVSAEQAAGYGDFCHQLRQSGFCFRTTLFPAVMQGERAEQSLLQALAEVAERERDFDAVVIIRGGGAVSDLGCFDAYTLAAVCAQFPLPVFTGIGHTRDVSVLDMVAHTPLKTPTAVAAFLITRMERLLEHVQHLRQRVEQCGERQRLMRRHRIEMLRQRLMACSPERIFARGYSLAMAGGKVVRSAAALEPGTTLTTCFLDGEVKSVVS